MRAVTVVMMLLLVGCQYNPWRAVYLASGVDRLTQDDVAQRLGPPTATHRLSKGGMVWLYRYTVMPNWIVLLGECTDYVLTFDEKESLRRWARQPC